LSVMAISIVLKQNEKNMFTGDFYKQSDDWMPAELQILFKMYKNSFANNWILYNTLHNKKGTVSNTL
jgi:hypothetical protein